MFQTASRQVVALVLGRDFARAHEVVDERRGRRSNHGGPTLKRMVYDASGAMSRGVNDTVIGHPPLSVDTIDIHHTSSRDGGHCPGLPPAWNGTIDAARQQRTPVSSS